MAEFLAAPPLGTRNCSSPLYETTFQTSTIHATDISVLLPTHDTTVRETNRHRLPHSSQSVEGDGFSGCPVLTVASVRMQRHSVGGGGAGITRK